MFYLQIQSTSYDQDFNASVHIEMKGTYGFLSAVDYPLLPVSYLLILFIRINAQPLPLVSENGMFFVRLLRLNSCSIE